MLARRVIHYNSRQMYFECNHGVVAEDGSRIRGRYHHMDLHLRDGADAPLMSSTYDESLLLDMKLVDWSTLVFSYGKRELSRPTDKLPACESPLPLHCYHYKLVELLAPFAPLYLTCLGDHSERPRQTLSRLDQGGIRCRDLEQFHDKWPCVV